MWLRISPGKTPAAASAMYPSSRLTAVVPLLTALVGLAPDLASGAHHRRTSLHTTSECVDIESCAACAEAGCAFASDTCTAGPSSDLGMCCDEDTSKAKGASWLCDDGCNTCSCDHTGAISAKGCEIMSNEQQPESLDSELVVVVLASVPAVLCILACLGIFCLCFCYRKKGKALSLRQLERDEEADQLAAGD